jgi:hypothetical protein
MVQYKSMQELRENGCQAFPPQVIYIPLACTSCMYQLKRPPETVIVFGQKSKQSSHQTLVKFV